jgi:DNA-binding NtrC family response regulator
MASADEPIGAGRRILIVEDEYFIAQDVAAALEDLGYTVAGPVPSVEEALAAIATEKLDAVLLDANLFGTSSAPVAAELAARGLPFVVVTGYGDFDLLDPDLQAAPRLIKPVANAELAAMVAKTIGQ